MAACNESDILNRDALTESEREKFASEIKNLRLIKKELEDQVRLLRAEFEHPIKERNNRDKFSEFLDIIISDLNIKYGSNYPRVSVSTDELSEEKPTKYLIDDVRDTVYASSEFDFMNVVHVFHREWFGIRAAAGSLPGRKIAISAEENLSEQDLFDIRNIVLSLSPSKIVFHAMSPNMAALIHILSREFDSSFLFFVHHGAPSQWFHEPDRKAAFIALDMLDKGILRRVHIMRAGFQYSHKGLFTPILLNKSPRLEHFKTHFSDRLENFNVFIPGWTGWRKNIYVNAYAAALCEEVETIVAYGSDIILPENLQHKLHHVKFIDRVQTMHLMCNARLTMNASLVDCHPMANIESQALGVPCIQGNLFLDALEDHEYCTFTQVSDVNSVFEIQTRIRSCLSQDWNYMSEMTRDYQTKLDVISLDRYRDFLEL